MSSFKDIVSRGVVTAKDGSGKIRVLQLLLLNEDLREDIEHFEPYGFTSEPLTGAEVLATSLCGDREHTIAVVVPDRRFRPTDLKDGEVVIYDNKNRKIYLSEDGIRIEGDSSPVVVKSSSQVIVDAPTVLVKGNLIVQGNISATGEIADAGGDKKMSSMRETFNTHTHPDTDPPDQKM